MSTTTPPLIEELPPLRTMHNGTKQPLTFTDAEFNRRLTGLRTIMHHQELDAVIFTSYHNIKYYSDFLYTAFGRNYALVVTQESATTVTAGIDAGMPWRTSHADNIVYTDWQPDNLYAGIREALRRQAASPARVGVENDDLTIVTRAKLQAAFPDAALIDISAETMRQRMIKSQEEIDLITEGARIADIGGEAIRNAIREGATEYELALTGIEAMTHEIARTFPHREIRDTWAWVQSGINTDGAHNWATTRRLRKGDLLSLNCFPMISGYYTALERTLFLGEPDDRTLELWAVNVEVHRRGIELIQPGAVCKDIAVALNEIYREHGLLANRAFGYGHSFGVLSHYYGREAGLELRENVDTVLEPGMVVSMEPMITIMEGELGSGGYREHDIIVVGERAGTNITGFPFGPDHNIIDA